MDFTFKRQLQKLSINFRYAFRPHKPILLYRLAKTFITLIATKKVLLRYVDLAIDYGCNLKCEHCFATAFERMEEEVKAQNGKLRKLNLDDYRSIAVQCMELGAVNFSFQGGEPTLFMDDLCNIISCFQPKKNVISVTTNATVLNEQKIKRLKKVGVDVLTISLDSGIPEEHDAFRKKKGNFRKAVEIVELALKNNINVTIGTTVTHNNLRSKGIREIVEKAIKWRVNLVFSLAVPIGNWDNNPDVLLTKEDREYLNKLTALSPYIKTDMEANYLAWGCGAVKEILYITPYGDVLPCPFIHISLGNSFEKPIKEIRRNGLKNPYYKSYYPKCLCAEDKPFIDRYLSKTFGRKDLPIPNPSESELYY